MRGGPFQKATIVAGPVQASGLPINMGARIAAFKLAFRALPAGGGLAMLALRTMFPCGGRRRGRCAG